MDPAGLRPLIIAFVQLGTHDELTAAVRARPELLTAEAVLVLESGRAALLTEQLRIARR